MYGVLSKVKKLDGLLLANILNEDLVKFQIGDDLLSEDKILDAFDKEFQVDISWKQTNICFGFNK